MKMLSNHFQKTPISGMTAGHSKGHKTVKTSTSSDEVTQDQEDVTVDQINSPKVIAKKPGGTRRKKKMTAERTQEHDEEIVELNEADKGKPKMITVDAILKIPEENKVDRKAKEKADRIPEVTQDFEEENVEPISEDKMKKLGELSLDALVKKVSTPKQLKELQSMEEFSMKDAPNLDQMKAHRVDEVEIISYKEVDEDFNDNKPRRKGRGRKAKSGQTTTTTTTEVTREYRDNFETVTKGTSQVKSSKEESKSNKSREALSREGISDLPLSALPKASLTPSATAASGTNVFLPRPYGKTVIKKDQPAAPKSITRKSDSKKPGSHKPQRHTSPDNLMGNFVNVPDRSLLQQSCYHGFVDNSYVEKTLTKEGDFLVCLMAKADEEVEYIYIAVRYKEIITMRVLQKNRKFSLGEGAKDKAFDQIATLIHHYYSSKEPLPSTKDVILKTVALVPNWVIAHNRVNLGKEVGRGAFGAVHKAWLKINGVEKRVAVKTMKETRTIKPKQREEFLTEAYVMLQLHHENIVKIIGVATQHPPLMIILEYMAKGSLRSHLQKQGGQISLPRRLKFCIDSAAGLAHMEKLHWVHRDVAARNCLISKEGQVKISDFGLTMERKALKNYKPKSLTLPIKWLAPEILRDQVFSTKSDVWAYGVMVYEIFNDGKEPYPGTPNSEIRKKLIDGSGFRMKLNEKTPRAIADIANVCWHENPANRPSFELIHKDLQLIGKFIIDKDV